METEKKKKLKRKQSKTAGNDILAIPININFN